MIGLILPIQIWIAFGSIGSFDVHRTLIMIRTSTFHSVRQCKSSRLPRGRRGYRMHPQRHSTIHYLLCLCILWHSQGCIRSLRNDPSTLPIEQCCVRLEYRPFSVLIAPKKVEMEREGCSHVASGYRNQSAVHRLNNIGSEPHEIRRR